MIFHPKSFSNISLMTLALATLTRASSFWRLRSDADFEGKLPFTLEGTGNRRQIANLKDGTSLEIREIHQEDKTYFRPIREFYLKNSGNQLYKDFTCKAFWKPVDLGGKSGSYMWKSTDKQFILKTMKKDDVNGLKRILEGQEYLTHLSHQSGSLLPRILTVFKIEQLKGSNDTHAMVMNNWCNLKNMYDLKGSIHNRYDKNKCMVFLRKFKMGQIKIVSTQKEQFRDIFKKIKSDVEFLRRQCLLDYSLGIWVIKGHIESNKQQAPSVRVTCNGEKYMFYFGIVDILQPWTKSKNLEARSKVNRMEPSCTHYDRYAARMLCFLSLVLPFPKSEKTTLQKNFQLFDIQEERKNLNLTNRQRRKSGAYLDHLQTKLREWSIANRGRGSVCRTIGTSKRHNMTSTRKTRTRATSF